MGIFKKLKDILYDEEDYTEQIKITPEMREEAAPQKEITKEIPKKEEIIQPKKEEVKVNNEPVKSERELFQSNQFPFFDFDKEEFERNTAPAKVQREEPKIERRETKPNVLEIERTKKVERRIDYGRYEKTEITQTTERKKFKPSPTISPVYGILNKDYEKDDIQQRSNVDVQTVRDKAFGDMYLMDEPKVTEEKTKPKTTYYEESDTVTISAPEKQEQKVKTIDELLEDTDIKQTSLDEDIVNELNTIEQELDIPRKTKVEKDKEPTEEIKTPIAEDTLESDLFNLIDSMYDSSEDGE